MHSRYRIRLQSVLALSLLSVAGIAVTARFLLAQAAAGPAPLDASFEQYVKPFFQQNCIGCHNSETGTAGIRVDQLDAKLEDRHIQAWEAIRNRVRGGTMPPKGMPQPSSRRPPAHGRVDWKRFGNCPLASRPEERPGPAPDRGAVSEHAPRIAVARRRSDREPSARRDLQRRFREQQGHAATVALVDRSLF